MRVTKDQISICKLRQGCQLSCRDCKYDGRCEIDLNRLMVGDIEDTNTTKTKQRGGQENGYQQI